MESSIWTSTGTTLSPMPNPFCDFAKKDDVCFLGVQMPFRGMRRKEAHPGTIQEAARQAMEAIRPLVCLALTAGRLRSSIGGGIEDLDYRMLFILSAISMRTQIASGNCPYVLVGYSMGSWIAYELLCMAKREGLPLPVHFIIAAMVSPDLPKTMRPWKCTATLDTHGFQVSSSV